MSYCTSAKKGFSLIEILVAVAIIALLSLGVVASLTRASDKAFDVQALNRAQQFQQSVERFSLFEDRWPTAGSTNHPTRGFPIGSNCANFEGTNHHAYLNWQETIADMGSYLPDYFHVSSHEWPFCIYYFRQDHPNCDSVSNYDYGVVFGLRDDSNWFDIDTFINELTDGEHAYRGCLYPL